MLTDLLSGLAKLASTIYSHAESVTENKKHCKELHERLLRIEFSVADLLKGSSDPDRYKVFLQPLEECLQECFEFLNQVNPTVAQSSSIKNSLMKLKNFGKAKSVHKKFDQLYNRLGQIEADLTLALSSRSIHYLREIRKQQSTPQSASSPAAASDLEKESKLKQETKISQESSELEAVNSATYAPPVTLLYQAVSKGAPTQSPGLLATSSHSLIAKSESSLSSASSYLPPSQILYKADAIMATTRSESPGQESLKEKALANNPEAQNNLGDCYYHGKGVKQNYDKAFFWFSKAAAAHHTIAQYNLGNCFYKGHGTPQNYSIAVQWYTKAAQAGDADAQNNLGNCFKKGRIGAPDLVKAREWFRMAANQGHAEAQFNYAICLHHGEGGARDEKTAIEWYRKAANQGNATAKAYLGFCYEKGQGVAVNMKLAFELYQQAAETGDAFGKERLEKLQKRHGERSDPKLVTGEEFMMFQDRFEIFATRMEAHISPTLSSLTEAEELPKVTATALPKTDTMSMGVVSIKQTL